MQFLVSGFRGRVEIPLKLFNALGDALDWIKEPRAADRAWRHEMLDLDAKCDGEFVVSAFSHTGQFLVCWKPPRDECPGEQLDRYLELHRDLDDRIVCPACKTVNTHVNTEILEYLCRIGSQVDSLYCTNCKQWYDYLLCPFSIDLRSYK